MTETTTPRHATVGFDLYRDVHKAIRVNLFDVTAEAGRLDPADQAARMAHAARVRDLMRFLEFHADHEEERIDDAVRRVLPEQSAAIFATHRDLEAQMAALVALAELVHETGRDDARASVHALYLGLARFTSAYLAHQDVEEQVVMPALWDAYGIEPLLEIHERILATISPEDMGWSLAKMLPPMNVEDRVEMFLGMRASAPAEAFAGVRALASQVLDPADGVALEARLAAVPEPAAAPKPVPVA